MYPLSRALVATYWQHNGENPPCFRWAGWIFGRMALGDLKTRLRIEGRRFTVIAKGQQSATRNESSATGSEARNASSASGSEQKFGWIICAGPYGGEVTNMTSDPHQDHLASAQRCQVGCCVAQRRNQRKGSLSQRLHAMRFEIETTSAPLRSLSKWSAHAFIMMRRSAKYVAWL